MPLLPIANTTRLASTLGTLKKHSILILSETIPFICTRSLRHLINSGPWLRFALDLYNSIGGKLCDFKSG